MTTNTTLEINTCEAVIRRVALLLPKGTWAVSEFSDFHWAATSAPLTYWIELEYFHKTPTGTQVITFTTED